jgi:hypothetical protein
MEWISALAAAIGSIAALLAVFVAWLIWQKQKLLSQRQLVLPLWEYMAKLNAIDPKAPIVPVVVKTMNTLELVALCCEGEMVDIDIIKTSFLHPFIELYDLIDQIQDLPGSHKSGRQILMESPIVMSFYQRLTKEPSVALRHA